MNINFNIQMDRYFVNDFDSLFLKQFRISRFKFFVLELLRYTDEKCIFELELGADLIGRDHARPKMSLYFWKYMFSMYVYDCRHWDFENNCWCSDENN